MERALRPFNPVDPKRLEEARALYENGHRPVPEIAASLGISLTVFYERVRIWGWARRRRRRVRANARAGEGRGPVVQFRDESEGELWHGPRWAPDDRVSETVKTFAESPALNRLEQARREAETLRHLLQALRGLQALEADEAARSARRAATRRNDCDGPSEDEAEAMRRELAWRIRRMKAAAG